MAVNWPVLEPNPNPNPDPTGDRPNSLEVADRIENIVSWKIRYNRKTLECAFSHL